MKSSKCLAYTFLFLAQLMVGICIVASKSLLVTMPALSILGARFTLGFIFLLILHFLFQEDHSLKGLTYPNSLIMVIQALCAGVFFNFLVLLGLHYTSASVAGMVTSALPAIVALFSILFLKEHFTLTTSACILFAILGLVIINIQSFHTGDLGHLWGSLLILAALVPDAAYYILSKSHPSPLPLFLTSALMNALNIPLVFLCMWIGHSAIPAPSLHQVLLLLSLGMGSALFYVFWLLGSQRVSGITAGLSTAFMPIGTLIIASLFLHESITWIQFVGMLLVILSIGLGAKHSDVTLV